MARTLSLLLVSGLAATSAFQAPIRPKVVNMKAEKDNSVGSFNLFQKAGAVLPLLFVPFANTPITHATEPLPRTEAIVQKELGSTNLVAGFFDSWGQPSRPSGRESARLGLQELQRSMRDPNSIKETMELLKDPGTRAEVQRLMNDPQFKAEMKKLTESPEFQQAMRQAQSMTQELQRNPAKMDELRRSLLR